MYISIKVRAEVKKTEDLDKVLFAISNLITFDKNDVKVREEGERIIIQIETKNINALEPLHNLIRQDRVIDAVAKALKRNRVGNITTLYLNREAAYMKHINLYSPDSDLFQPIEIVIASENLDKILDWLVPPTKEGKPLFELKIDDLKNS